MLYSNIRNQRIDFLRGLAILVVLILHFHIIYHLDQSALNKILSVDFIKAIAGNGNYGVTMFFVISGFLITTTSLERYGQVGKLDILNFYIFRFARIMPCLLLALTFIIFFHFTQISIFQNKPNTTTFLISIFSVLTFWHNVLIEKAGFCNYCLNIYWSLSVEEIFYIAFPIICLICKRAVYIVLFLIVLIIIGPIYRSFYTDNEIISLYSYLSCFDAIAIGCCGAIIINEFQFKDRIKKIMQYGGGLLIAFAYLENDIMSNIVIGVSLVAFGTAIFLIGAQNITISRNPSGNLLGRVICWFGKNSYELYLFHIIVLALMKSIYSSQMLGTYSTLLWMLIFFTLSALLAGCIAKYYSAPMNTKLRQLFLDLRRRNLAPLPREVA